MYKKALMGLVLALMAWAGTEIVKIGAIQAVQDNHRESITELIKLHLRSE